jgi:hypothetical protein
MELMATEKCLWCQEIKQVPPVEDRSRRHIICPKCLELAGKEWMPQAFLTPAQFIATWITPFQKKLTEEGEH